MIESENEVKYSSNALTFTSIPMPATPTYNLRWGTMYKDYV